MRKNDTKLFLSKPKLYQLANLRINGLALTSLATLFGCHITSIEYQCEKYQIQPKEEVITLERIISQIIPKPTELTYKLVNGEKINLGKNYKEYIKAV